MVMSGEEQLALGIQVGNVFRPSSPIDEKALFAGRTDQIRRVIDVIFQRGQHAIIFGERGVGKTSLANVISDFMQDTGKTILAPHLNCDRTDDFSKLWRKIFSEIIEAGKMRKIGFLEEYREPISAAETMPKKITPNDVRLKLTQLSHEITLIVIIDEFDRLKGKEIRELFADTIKTLSDHAVPASLILVGVAESVSELVAHHQSIERSLVQVHMPRMATQELAEILTKGLSTVGMEINSLGLHRICMVSKGLPHYTHLIGLHSARVAIDEGEKRITMQHVEEGINKALADAQQTIQEAYHKATMTTRKESLFSPVLLACTLAEIDDFGCFAAGDLRDPLSQIMGKPYDIPNYARHLQDLCTDARGPVLKKVGTKHRSRFHFIDPLMQPYILMKGFVSKQIPARLAQPHL